jgi:hypothetical protein
MIFQRFRRNKKRKDKTDVTVANSCTVAEPPRKTARGGDLAGFAKFMG